jgi:hypothetical protein
MYGMGGGLQQGGGMMGPSIMEQAAGMPTAQDVPGTTQGMDALDSMMEDAVNMVRQIAGRYKFEDAKAANSVEAIATKLEKIRLDRQQDVKSAQELNQAQQLIGRM